MKIMTYPAFCEQSVALSRYNSMAHPSENRMISPLKDPVKNLLVISYGTRRSNNEHLSHLAPGNCDVVSPFRLETPFPRGQPTLRVQHKQLRGRINDQLFQLDVPQQPKSFSHNPRNISINSKLGYLAIMYLDALTIITVITLQIEVIVKSVI